jgi:hypothetical protein
MVFSTVNLPRATRRQLTQDFTTVTHGHVRAIIADDLYVECLRQLLLGQPPGVSDGGGLAGDCSCWISG